MSAGDTREELLRPLGGSAEPTRIVSLEAAQAAGAGAIDRLPRSLKVLAEDALYRLPFDEARAQVGALCARDKETPVTFRPGRALLQDFMGIPLMTDMATMRDVLAARGADPAALNPVIPVDFVVDHSLSVMVSGRADALPLNRQMELERNRERFEFIKWSQGSFSNFRVIPPGRGIMHQVNLEWLSHVVRRDGEDDIARPDTMIGTDSHTTMVNALGVLGWGVGGIEAEMAMLGIPLELSAPRVVGVELTGALPEGATATDLVLHMASFLRGIGVVGAFVEFFGEGVGRLALADRATIANMSPEYGATCTYFPIDRLTIEYLRMTGRTAAHLDLVERYARAQGLWCEADGGEAPDFDARHSFDLGQVEPSMAGPARPEDRMPLGEVPASFRSRLSEITGSDAAARAPAGELGHGSVVIAAITSCTNTSNPELMMTAGLVARNAERLGLRPKPWVKTSFSPGSRVVTDYLDAAGLTGSLDALGFQNVGYGCATCNGNSGPLDEDVTARIEEDGLCTVAVLSGNRNFEGRIHPLIKGAYLASPPLVIAAAIAGTVNIDLGNDALGEDAQGRPVALADLWPDRAEVEACVTRHVTAERFIDSYREGMETTPEWAAMEAPQGQRFSWDEDSTFIRPSPFPEMGPAVRLSGTIGGVRPLVVLGDSVTTDHISPNGAIGKDSPAGRYLIAQGAAPARLGNFGTRRGNAEVCLRGMFDNPLLRNELVDDDTRGNATVHQPSGARMTIYEAGRRYVEEGTPTIVIAGRNYGAGSSRDWAAKGLRGLGAVAVLAESFERIHRSNLIGMGVLPLVFEPGASRGDLMAQGPLALDIVLGEARPHPRMAVTVRVTDGQGRQREIAAHLAAHSDNELALLEQGGILPAILSRLEAPDATGHSAPAARRGRNS
ncbi:aconitate hydratase AcnA [Rhodobacteraceae bacterium WD3A24]|nr:aconitate hydratase AcnA [Rhodobacteraceae bacterium WD3A24]